MKLWFVHDALANRKATWPAQINQLDSGTNFRRKCARPIGHVFEGRVQYDLLPPSSPEELPKASGVDAGRVAAARGGTIRPEVFVVNMTTKGPLVPATLT